MCITLPRQQQLTRTSTLCIFRQITHQPDAAQWTVPVAADTARGFSLLRRMNATRKHPENRSRPALRQAHRLVASKPTDWLLASASAGCVRSVPGHQWERTGDEGLTGIADGLV